MRRHAQSWIIKAALAGIIIVFIFFFGWGGSPERSKDYAAKVNDTVISRDLFHSIYASKVEQIRLRFKGGSIPPELLEKMNLKMDVAQGLVNQILLAQEGERLGLVVTTEDLVQDIRSNPMFQRNGMFDESMYRVYLQTIKMSLVTVRADSAARVTGQPSDKPSDRRGENGSRRNQEILAFPKRQARSLNAVCKS